MKKSRIAISLAITLVFVSVAINAQAVVKNGANCSKVGSITKAGTKKFICSRVGNKKIWRVQDAKPKPNPLPSTSSSPIPTPTPSPTPVQIDPKSYIGKECNWWGDRINIASDWIECRPVAEMKLKWFFVEKTKPDPSLNSPQNNIQDCMIKDARPVKNGLSSGFPLFRNVPAVGKVKVALIPIDFSDTVGDYSADGVAQPQIEKVDAWLKQFTNGKLSYDWQVTKDWIRNPKKIADYGVASTTHFGYFDDRELVQDLLNTADPFVDFTGVKIVIFLFPRTITALPIQVIGQNNRVFTTKEGSISNYWGGGKFAYQQDYEKLLWAIWLHETLHMHGLPEHAPGNGWPLTITSNQYATALAIDTWESFLAGWLDEKSIVCIKQSELKDLAVTLTPVDRNQTGTKSVMIPMSDHEILVVESRRAEDFSSELPFGFYGITAYIVDTSKDNDRSAESSGKDNGNDPTYSKFAYYLYSSSGIHPKLRLVRGQLDTNILAFEGESFIYKGVKITLVKSGDFDTIQIQKVG